MHIFLHSTTDRKNFEYQAIAQMKSTMFNNEPKWLNISNIQDESKEEHW